MRPTKARTIGCIPTCRRFGPFLGSEETEVSQDSTNNEVITIGLDMLEAMRLVDAEGMNQEEAARSMEVSTPTLCRILGQGRRLAALALTTGKIINIEGGNIMYYNAMHGRHGHHLGSGHGGWQGQDAMQGGGACSRSEGIERVHGQGMGRGRCGAGRGKCMRRNVQAGTYETNAECARTDIQEN